MDADAAPLPHLHVHLEPGQRRPAGDGRVWLTRGSVTTRQSFFARHAGTPSDVASYSSTTVLRNMLKAFLREQEADGVGYVEVRVSPDRWTRDGMKLHEFLHTVDDVLSASDCPIGRAVVLVNRRAAAADVVTLRAALASFPGRSIVGVDLAGDERAHPDVRPFVAFFEWARHEGLGTTVHAGEFGDSRTIWEAVDELGAQRIGHGLAAAADAALTKRLVLDRTLVEVSVSSNLALGAWDGAGLHPAAALLDAGVPLCFNSDVPLHTGASLRSELETAAVALGVGRLPILEMQRRAWGHTFAGRSPPRR